MATTTTTSTNPYSSSSNSSTGTSSAFKYDRRGFDVILQSLLVLIVLSALILVFYNWQIGLALLLLSCIYFITVEAISARPDNNPTTFVKWYQRRDSTTTNCPVILCIGDSITHGNCSSSYTSEIPYQLSLILGLPIPPDKQTFGEPVYVVNAGQNCITSHTVLYERFLPLINTIRPDYILLLIGTNDVQAMYAPKTMGKFIQYVNGIPSNQMNIQAFERNIQQMIDFIAKEEVVSPHVQFAICTLPPMGENLQSKANHLIRQTNTIIETLVHKASCPRITVIPLYNELEKVIQQEKKVPFSIPVDLWFLVSLIMSPLYHLSYGFISWNVLSSCINHVVLSDGLHFNEYGRDIFVKLIINEWLYKKNITKAIAVKKFR